MNDVINQSINFIKGIDLKEKDLEKFFNVSNDLIKNPGVKEILDKIIKTEKIRLNDGIKKILVIISNELSLKDLNMLMKQFTNKDDIIDYI